MIPDVIQPCKPSGHFRATYMTSFTTSFSTTDRHTAASRRFQGMPSLPTFCQRGRAQRSTHPGHSRKRCWFPRTGTAERSWPTRCCQRTGRNSWCKRSRWSPLGVGEKEWCMKSCIDIMRGNCIGNLSNLTCKKSTKLILPLLKALCCKQDAKSLASEHLTSAL